MIIFCYMGPVSSHSGCHQPPAVAVFEIRNACEKCVRATKWDWIKNSELEANWRPNCALRIRYDAHSPFKHLASLYPGKKPTEPHWNVYAQSKKVNIFYGWQRKWFQSNLGIKAQRLNHIRYKITFVSLYNYSTKEEDIF